MKRKNSSPKELVINTEIIFLELKNQYRKLERYIGKIEVQRHSDTTYFCVILSNEISIQNIHFNLN